MGAGGDVMTLPYLKTSEAAEIMRLSPKTLQNMVGRGLFQEGKHFYRRRGQIGIRWDRLAIMAWVEGRDVIAVDDGVIPLAHSGGR
jgi:hypothetical protein